jgi:polar amino acid transport system substrate-binding protein
MEFSMSHRTAWFLALTLACLASVSRAEPVVIFADNDYQPVIYLNAEQQPAGLLAEVMAHVGNVSGTEVDLRLYPWKRALASATQGKGGIIGISMTPERLALFDYSAPIYDDTISVVMRKGHEFSFKHLADLRGRKIGVQLGASYGPEVDAAIRSGLLQIEEDQSQKARLGKLLHNRIDAAFIGNGQLGLDTLLASDDMLAKHRDEFVTLQHPLSHDRLYLAFAKSMGMQAFLTEFNRILLQAQEQRLIPGLTPLSQY